MSRSSLILALWRQNRSMPILVVCLVLLNLGGYLAQTRLLDPELTSLRGELRGQQLQLRQLKQQSGQSGTPTSALEKAEKDLQRFRNMIPAKEKLAAFIGDLVGRAGKADLEIKQIAYRPEPIEEHDLLQYSLSFSVSGSYAQLKRFIHLLEESRRIMSVDQISLAGKEQQEEGSSVSLRIQLTTYFSGGQG